MDFFGTMTISVHDFDLPRQLSEIAVNALVLRHVKKLHFGTAGSKIDINIIKLIFWPPTVIQSR